MADKSKQPQDQYYTRPPKLSGWESFKIFFWNSETHQFCGRTGSSWGKCMESILVFVCVNQEVDIASLGVMKEEWI